MKSKSLLCLRWAAAAAAVILLAALAWQCIDIYRVGNLPENVLGEGVYQTQVYRREDIAARLKAMTPLMWTCAAVLAVAAAAHLAWGMPGECSGITPENRLRLVKARIGALPEAAACQERFRRIVWSSAGVLMGLFSVPCILYLAQRSHFTDLDALAPVDAMLVHIVPWIVLIFLVAAAAFLLCDRSISKELAALKGVPIGAVKASAAQKTNPSAILRWVLYAVAALFILLGVMNGGAWDVLVKAINICTECIGLG